MNLTTTYSTKPNGAGKITAKGQGKQRSVNYDPALSVDANHGGAAGALLTVLLDERQQAMLRHPSGGKRVTVDIDPDMARRRWTVSV